MRDRGAETALVISLGTNEASRRLYESSGSRCLTASTCMGRNCDLGKNKNQQAFDLNIILAAYPQRRSTV